MDKQLQNKWLKFAKAHNCTVEFKGGVAYVTGNVDISEHELTQLPTKDMGRGI